MHLFIALLLPLAALADEKPIANNTGLEFIDTSLENASPLWYEFADDNSIQIHLLYDHERNSPNRAAGHFHFLLHAKPGSKLTIEFRNLDNVYDGRPGSVAKDLKLAVVSQDGRDWKPMATEILPDNRVRLTVEMPGPKLYVARIEPYRLSDLDRFLAEIRKSPLVQITPIGKTVQGRELEIVRIGDARAPYRVFIRARAHPWEPGGNWILEGLIRRLLRDDADAEKFRQCFCLYTLPLANKDGVARGGTRFNLQGKDLNRGWDQPADPLLAPENHALETWLEGMIRAGQRPHLALELHNDANGQLHVSNPPEPKFQRYAERMAMLESLLRKHTWFTEGRKKPTTHPTGTLADGWVERFGIDAAVHEFNANWIAGVNDYPSARHWQDYGEKLADVFCDYFESVKP